MDQRTSNGSSPSASARSLDAGTSLSATAEVYSPTAGSGDRCETDDVLAPQPHKTTSRSSASTTDDHTLHSAPSDESGAMTDSLKTSTSSKTVSTFRTPQPLQTDTPTGTMLFDTLPETTGASRGVRTNIRPDTAGTQLTVDTASSMASIPLNSPRGGSPTLAANSTAAARASERRFGPYLLHRTLGEGQFGKVKLATLAPPTTSNSPSNTSPATPPSSGIGHHVAIKLVRKETIIRDPVRRTKLAREIALLRRVCSHPNIVTLEQVIETERYVGIVMEYAQGGELFDRILASKFLKPDETRWFFLQLLDGVQHLHQRGVVHRDLKLENLLLAWDEEGPRGAAAGDGRRNPAGAARERIVITDFGFATTIITDAAGNQQSPLATPPPDASGSPVALLAPPPEIPHRLLQTSCGSPCYAAPELVLGDPEGKGYDGVKADLWSCGVILYAMCCGYLPFDDDPNNPQSSDIQLLYKHIMSSQLTFPKHVPMAIRDVIEGLLRRNPKQRWSWNEVQANDWVKTGNLATAVPVTPRAAVGRVEEKLAAAVAAAGLVSAQQRKPGPYSVQAKSGLSSTMPGASPNMVGDFGSSTSSFEQPAGSRVVSDLALPPQIESGIIKALAKDISAGAATVEVKPAQILEPEAARTSKLTFARRFTAPWRSNEEDAFGRAPRSSGRGVFGSRASMASSHQSRMSALSAASSRVSQAFSSAGRSIAAFLLISKPSTARTAGGERFESGDETIEDRDADVADVDLTFEDDDAPTSVLSDLPAFDLKQRAPDLIVAGGKQALEVRMLVESTLRDLAGCEWRGWGSARDGGSWTCRASFLGTAATSSSALPLAEEQNVSRGFFSRLLGRNKPKPSGANGSSVVTTEISIVSMSAGKIGVTVRRAVDDALGEDVWAWTARKRTVVDAIGVVLGVRKEVEGWTMQAGKDSM